MTAERSTSITVAEVIEDGTQTRVTVTQNIETQTSVEIPQQQQLVPTTVAVIETYHQASNGAIPKHSRKKSLPEAAYLPRLDTTPEPYVILDSPPKMRPRPNTYSEVNSRPHSSISMVYTDTWPGSEVNQRSMVNERPLVSEVNQRSMTNERPLVSEAAARTERQFHTLERESARVRIIVDTMNDF